MLSTVWKRSKEYLVFGTSNNFWSDCFQNHRLQSDVEHSKWLSLWSSFLYGSICNKVASLSRCWSTMMPPLKSACSWCWVNLFDPSYLQQNAVIWGYFEGDNNGPHCLVESLPSEKLVPVLQFNLTEVKVHTYRDFIFWQQFQKCQWPMPKKVAWFFSWHLQLLLFRQK